MKKLIALILAIVMILTLAINTLAETYEEYASAHTRRMWVPEDLYNEDLLYDLDIEAITIYNLYPSTARVKVVDLYEDIVVFTDGFNDWIVEGAEDWVVGDLASLLMFDAFTGNTVEDDVILLAWYAGNI